MRRRFLNLHNNRVGAGNASNPSLHTGVNTGESLARVKKTDAIHQEKPPSRRLLEVAR
jgi:hypothetical protein